MTDAAQGFSHGYVPGFEFDVFVSYARATNHSEPEETGWVTDFHRRLSKILAIDCPETKIFFDERSIDGNANLDHRIVSAVQRSAVFVVILAPVYLSRPYCIKELDTFRECVNEKDFCARTFLIHYHLVPLEERPDFLRQQTGYNFYWEDPQNPSIRIPINYTTQRELYDRSIYGLSGAITNQLKAMKTAIVQESGAKTKAVNDNTDGAVNRLAPERFDLTRLPTVSGSFFGRLDEVKRLHTASEHPNEHVLSIVARGGEGKTSLITNWLNELHQNSWAGYHRVFAWSFYSQGTNDRVSNADEFMAAARKFFQDKAPDEILTPHQQGKRLAELVSRERNLLILDGLEPLQYPPGAKSGMIKDLSLQVFLKSLANMNNGLCVITTREPVTELQSHKDTSCPELALSPMDVDRGSEFLRSLGVKGTNDHLAEVVATLDGHALSLELIGSYINQSYDGRVELWDSKTLPMFDDRVSNHADQVLLSYENWLSGKNLGNSAASQSGGNFSTLGLKLLQIVRLLGLFDRPVSVDLIVSLSFTSEITGLNESFIGNSREEIARVLHRLCTMRFLRKTGADTASIGESKTSAMYDCHPLVRSYFERSLKQFPTSSLRKMHSAVYEFLLTQAPEFPATAQENAPLFQAIRHGCLAGRYSDALEMYRHRICHSGTSYPILQLGQFEQVLDSLSHFYTFAWTKPKKLLDIGDQRLLSNQVGLSFGGLAKAKEALEAFKISIDIARRTGDGESGVLNLINACHACSCLGNTADELTFSEEAMGAFAQDLHAATKQGLSLGQLTWPNWYLARVHWAHACLDAGCLTVASQAMTIAESWVRSVCKNWDEVNGGESVHSQSDIAIEIAIRNLDTAKPNPLKQIERLLKETNFYRMDSSSELHAESFQNRLSKVTLTLCKIQVNCDANQNAPTNLDETKNGVDKKQIRELQPLLNESIDYLQKGRNQMFQLRLSVVRLSFYRTAFRVTGDNSFLDDFDSTFDEVYSIGSANGLYGLLIDAILKRAHLMASRNFKGDLREHLRDLDARIDATLRPYDPKITDWPDGNRPKLYDHFANLKAKLRPGQKLMIGYERHRDTIKRLRRKLG